MWIGPEKHKIVGKRLEAARKDSGLSQVQLAKKLRKPQSFVSSYERGQRRMDMLEFTSVVLAIGGDVGAIATDIFDAIVPPSKRKLAADRRS